MEGRATGRSLSVVHQVETHDVTGDVQAMFQRMLTGWAMDALSLRRRGLDRPCRRTCAGVAQAIPGRHQTMRRLESEVLSRRDVR
jgi:hypothetical protein